MLKQLLTTAALTVSLTQTAQAEALMAFDVAEDHTRLFMSDAPVHDDGMPAHGNAFISQGYLYPAGTLAPDTTGVLADGSPAFPDLVLGTWTCDGFFVGEGANAATGVWLVSRQIFDFGDGDVLITQGTEIVDTGVENLRPITGGTGDYDMVDGGVYQTLLGFNDHMAVNATFRVADQARDYGSYIPGYGGFEAYDPGMGDVPMLDETLNTEWDSGMPVGPLSGS